jgi:hypothetical protein
MKYLYFLLLAVSVVIAGCVDDYTDSNPPGQIDGPFITLSAIDENIDLAVSQPLNKYTAYVKYGSPVEITVNVINAPGKIGSVSVRSSIEEFGTVALDEASFNAIKGQTSGSFKFIFKPSTILVGTSDRLLNVEVALTDQQLDYKGEESPLTTTITVPITLVSGPCVSSQIAAGQYKVTSATGVLDDGDAYDETDLSANSDGIFSGKNVIVTITRNRPGVYTFSEISGGVVPVFYGWTSPNVRVNLCDNQFTGRTGYLTFGTLLDDDENGIIDDYLPDNDGDGEYTEGVDGDGIPDNDGVRVYTVDGTVNSDGTITVNWSYVTDDPFLVDPTPAAHGTYTLTKFP